MERLIVTFINHTHVYVSMERTTKKHLIGVIKRLNKASKKAKYIVERENMTNTLYECDTEGGIVRPLFAGAKNEIFYIVLNMAQALERENED